MSDRRWPPKRGSAGDYAIEGSAAQLTRKTGNPKGCQTMQELLHGKQKGRVIRSAGEGQARLHE